jgi:hypothetical protein
MVTSTNFGDEAGVIPRSIAKVRPSHPNAISIGYVASAIDKAASPCEIKAQIATIRGMR